MYKEVNADKIEASYIIIHAYSQQYINHEQRTQDK